MYMLSYTAHFLYSSRERLHVYIQEGIGVIFETPLFTETPMHDEYFGRLVATDNFSVCEHLNHFQKTLKVKLFYIF